MDDGFPHGLGHEGLDADEGSRHSNGFPRSYGRAMVSGSGDSGTSGESDKDYEDDDSTSADDSHLAPDRAEVLAIGRGKGKTMI